MAKSPPLPSASRRCEASFLRQVVYQLPVPPTQYQREKLIWNILSDRCAKEQGHSLVRTVSAGYPGTQRTQRFDGWHDSVRQERISWQEGDAMALADDRRYLGGRQISLVLANLLEKWAGDHSELITLHSRQGWSTRAETQHFDCDLCGYNLLGFSNYRIHRASRTCEVLVLALDATHRGLIKAAPYQAMMIDAGIHELVMEVNGNGFQKRIWGPVWAYHIAALESIPPKDRRAWIERILRGDRRAVEEAAAVAKTQLGMEVILTKGYEAAKHHDAQRAALAQAADELRKSPLVPVLPYDTPVVYTELGKRHRRKARGNP